MAVYNEPDDAKNISKNTMYKLNMIMKLAALNLFRQVILKTPVDNGRARSNWQTTIGDFAKGVVDETKSTEQQITDMANTVYNARMKQGLFLTNNLPYIQKLEYGGYPNPAKTGDKLVNGFSKQAPAGMVRISMEQIMKDLSEIVEDVVSKKYGALKSAKEVLM
jgi:hypothetical protein